MSYLAIDIGGTYTKYAVMNENGEILEKDRVPTVKESQGAFVDSLESVWKQASGAEEDEERGLKGIADEEKGCRLKGIAISCAGMIDSGKGILHNAGTLYCVKDLPIVQVLEERCGVPVSIGNDAECAALAELWKGVLKDCRNAAALVIGTAVGGTMIIDRKVLKGRNGLAGEFSYIKANADNPADQTRNYGLYGGMPALIGLAAEKTGIPAEQLDGEKIFSLVRNGNKEAEASVREYAGRLAVLIMNLQFVTDPERVAVGGGVSAEPMLLDLVREELGKIAGEYPYPVPVPEIAACRFGNDANLIGALYLFLEQRRKQSMQ